MTLPLFDAYPAGAGFKRTGPSHEAAAAIDASALREAVAALLQARGAHTTDEAARALGRDRLSIRPRFSELRAAGRIFDTGFRRVNASGRRATVWGWTRNRNGDGRTG